MSSLSPSIISGGRRSRRKGNKSLTSWVAFVKKVAREEKLPYGKAMKRASVRKNKGEKWMTGGVNPSDEENVAPVPIFDANKKFDPTFGKSTSVDDTNVVYGTNNDDVNNFGDGNGDGDGAEPAPTGEWANEIDGGRRRRSKKSRRSKKRRGTKKRRGSRRRHH